MPSEKKHRAPKQLKLPEAQTKKKDTFHVLLPTETKARIEAILPHLHRRFHFQPPMQDVVQHLVVEAVERIEAEIRQATARVSPADVGVA